MIEPVVTETAVVGLETNASQMQEEEIEELKQLELLALDEITDTLKRIGKNRIEDCATHNWYSYGKLQMSKIRELLKIDLFKNFSL